MSEARPVVGGAGSAVAAGSGPRVEDLQTLLLEGREQVQAPGHLVHQVAVLPAQQGEDGRLGPGEGPQRRMEALVGRGLLAALSGISGGQALALAVVEVVPDRGAEQ